MPPTVLPTAAIDTSSLHYVHMAAIDLSLTHNDCNMQSCLQNYSDQTSISLPAQITLVRHLPTLHICARKVCTAQILNALDPLFGTRRI